MQISVAGIADWRYEKYSGRVYQVHLIFPMNVRHEEHRSWWPKEKATKGSANLQNSHRAFPRLYGAILQQISKPLQNDSGESQSASYQDLRQMAAELLGPNMPTFQQPKSLEIQSNDPLNSFNSEQMRGRMSSGYNGRESYSGHEEYQDRQNAADVNGHNTEEESVSQIEAMLREMTFNEESRTTPQVSYKPGIIIRQSKQDIHTPKVVNQDRPTQATMTAWSPAYSGQTNNLTENRDTKMNMSSFAGTSGKFSRQRLNIVAIGEELLKMSSPRAPAVQKLETESIFQNSEVTQGQQKQESQIAEGRESQNRDKVSILYIDCFNIASMHNYYLEESLKCSLKGCVLPMSRWETTVTDRILIGVIRSWSLTLLPFWYITLSCDNGVSWSVIVMFAHIAIKLCHIQSCIMHGIRMSFHP